MEKLSLKDYKEEYNWFTSICLNITNECNLRCKYCFVEQNYSSIDEQTAKDAVDYLYQNIQKKRKKHNNNNIVGYLNFFGGEPLLLYDKIIVPITNYINQYYKKDIKLGVTTNGTLLDKAKIDFFYENQISILLSFDGDRTTQDFNRPCRNSVISSFDLIEKNIPYLLEKYPNITCRMTLYNDTCKYMFNNVLYLEKMGFKRFFIVPDSRTNFSSKEIENMRNELRKTFTYFVSSICLGVKPIEGNIFEEGFLQAMQLKDKGETIIPCKDLNTCGIGTVSASIGPGGDIYACQEQVSNTKIDNYFYMGNIYSGIDIEKHQQIIEHYRSLQVNMCENENLCNTCVKRHLCNIPTCPSMSMTRFNNFFTQPETLCIWEQEKIKISMDILENIYNINLKQYLAELISAKEKESNNELYSN